MSGRDRQEGAGMPATAELVTIAKALTSIAESLAKLANPPRLVAGNFKVTSEMMRPGSFEYVPDGETGDLPNIKGPP